MRRSLGFWARPVRPAQSLTHLEIFTQMQLGIHPPLSTQRSFIQQHFTHEMDQRGITEAKLLAMDGQLCARLLRQLLFERYLSVPFRLFTFDLEFTGPPAFGPDGPTEDIMEFGFYSPARDESFSCLVQPSSGRRVLPEVTKLTHITEEMLNKKALPFSKAWERVMDFLMTPEPNELPESEKRILVLSHGGKLADVSLIKSTLEAHHMELPSSLVFGDTFHLIRDAHRRRPVTLDKHPPTWGLVDLVQWLKIPPTLPAHRAGNDAKMTWDALYHTLERYGDEDLTPREQLVSRFFDVVAKDSMSQEEIRRGGVRADGTLAEDSAQQEAADRSSLDFDFDEIFTPDGRQRHSQNRAGDSAKSDSDSNRASDTDALSEVRERARLVEQHPSIDEFIV